MEGTKKKLMESEYESHENQEKWSLERNKMLTEIEATKNLYVKEQARITDIVAEVVQTNPEVLNILVVLIVYLPRYR